MTDEPASFFDRKLPEALRSAAAHMRDGGDFSFLSNNREIDTAFQLADFIDDSAKRLESGDDSVGQRLWIIFAPTCTWDDAGGDSRLGQDVFELLDRFFRPA